MAEVATSEWSYKNQVILAPMVRVGLYPFRKLCANYGATMVYTDEIIDKKIAQCRRVVNEKLATVEFFSKSGELVFQTPSDKSERVVFQIGTANSNDAILGAQVVCNDVKAIDVNMGCPVLFSTQGGMGSALLNKPEVVSDIIRTLKRNLTVPITAKIRIRRNISESVDFVKMLCDEGVSCIAIHARHIPDRPRWRAMPEEIPLLSEIIENRGVTCCYNGDIFMHEDIEKFKALTKTNSVMIGRGALYNPSVFSSVMEAPLKLALEFIKICEDLETKLSTIKYVISEMVKGKTSHPHFEAITRAKSVAALTVALEDVGKDKSCQELYDINYYKRPELTERPWVIDPSVAIVPEYSANGPVSYSTSKNFYKVTGKRVLEESKLDED